MVQAPFIARNQPRWREKGTFMKENYTGDVNAYIARTKQDYSDARDLVMRVYGEVGLHKRKEVQRQDNPRAPGTRVVLVRIADEPVGTMAITAKAFAPLGESCRLELDDVYRYDANRQEDTAEVNRVAILRKFRHRRISSTLYLYAAQFSFEHGLKRWIGGIDLQTDCHQDAALMGRVLAAQGYLKDTTNLLQARNPEHAITPEFCSEPALRHFYSAEELAKLRISAQVRKFSKSWGARICGPIVLHPHYRRHVIAMQVHVPQVLELQQPIPDTAYPTLKELS